MAVILDARGEPLGESAEAKLARATRNMKRQLERSMFGIPSKIIESSREEAAPKAELTGLMHVLGI